MSYNPSSNKTERFSRLPLYLALILDSLVKLNKLSLNENVAFCNLHY
jgi:hypothetical protein